MISIIIPTLNEEKGIKKTLERLKEIKEVPVEIIVSDGASSGKTVEIARALADKVVVYEGRERQTIAGGRNLGASLAHGEFLLFLDADVTIENPDKLLQKIIDRFNTDSKLVGANCRLQVLPELATWRDKILSTICLDWRDYLSNNVFHIGSASGEFQFIRKSAFDRLGGFDEKLVSAEDINMFERLAKVGRTRLFYDLMVYHSGRRFHQVGWFKILYLWMSNYLYYKFRGHAKNKEWTVVR